MWTILCISDRIFDFQTQSPAAMSNASIRYTSRFHSQFVVINQHVVLGYCCDNDGGQAGQK